MLQGTERALEFLSHEDKNFIRDNLNILETKSLKQLACWFDQPFDIKKEAPFRYLTIIMPVEQSIRLLKESFDIPRNEVEFLACYQEMLLDRISSCV
jgi:hypothetical protein